MEGIMHRVTTHAVALARPGDHRGYTGGGKTINADDTIATDRRVITAG
jgi:hypothetical protein